MLVKKRHGAKSIINSLDKSKWSLFFLALVCALYWQQVSPIQYNGDSDTYFSIGRMILGHIGALYRSIGYPVLLLLAGAIIPGTFVYLLLIQALFAACIPVIIYQILKPFNYSLAIGIGIIAILSGVTTVHTSQLMTETFFTFLLFLGLYIAIKIVRGMPRCKSLFYWLALVFAMLNTVRPIGWPIFWSLIILLSSWAWHKKQLAQIGKSILGGMILFMMFMSSLVLIDDVFFSFGARYSPVFSPKSIQDTVAEIYLYDIPFYEAYYNPWRERVYALPEESNTYGRLENQPAMQQIRSIILQQIKKDKMLFSQDNSYPYQLFGAYVDDPQKLAYRMFAKPNYAYTLYIKTSLEQTLPKKKRLSLYHQAGKELGFNWPQRWFTQWYDHPFISFTGPSHGRSSQEFLLAYTSLRHYIPNPESNNYHSLVNPKNGPASRFLFSALTQGIKDHPDLWENTPAVFSSFITTPKLLTPFLIAKPNQQSAWDITRMLWNLMGFNTMSALLTKVSLETTKAYQIPYILRIWDNVLMTALGPGHINFDTLGPQLGSVEIYDYLEKPQQISEKEKREIQSTRSRYAPPPILNYNNLYSGGIFCFTYANRFCFLQAFLPLLSFWYVIGLLSYRSYSSSLISSAL